MSISVINKLEKLSLKKFVPLHIFFEITYGCNLICKHCYLVDKPKVLKTNLGLICKSNNDLKNNELKTDEIKKILTEVSSLGAFFITFTGGEVFTRNDIFEILSYSQKLKFAIRIFTNGTLINKKELNFLKKLQPIEVGISLYGATKETHEKITRQAGSFAKTINVIKLMRKNNIPVSMKCPLMNLNLKEYKALLNLGKKLGAVCKFDHTIVPMDDGNKDPLSLRLNKKNLFSLLQDKTLYPVEKITFSKDKNLMCDAGKNMATISPYGDVYPCIQLRIPFGNLREKTFKEIWEGKNTKKIRFLNNKDFKDCFKCELINFCGKCPGIAQLEDKSFLNKSSRACEIAQIRKEIWKKTSSAKK